MKIFISWSGARSAAVAEALKEYLPIINNAFDLWLSSDDIAKGSRSTLEIAKALTAAKAGIICLTPNNLTAPWILFEAGGIAKTVDQTLACTVLIDLQSSDVSKPLGEFQHTRLNQKELLKLVKDLNNAAGELARKDTEIDKAFKLCWPELSEKLKNLPSDGGTELPERTPRDMFAEILDTIRQTNAQVAELATQNSILDSIRQANSARMFPAVHPGLGYNPVDAPRFFQTPVVPVSDSGTLAKATHMMLSPQRDASASQMRKRRARSRADLRALRKGSVKP